MITQLTVKRWIATAVFAWFCSLSTANATLISPSGLTLDFTPDVFAWNAINYTGNTTDGFVMTVEGSLQSLDYGGTSVGLISGTCDFFQGCYDITANFSGAGLFLNGTIDLTYTGSIDVGGGNFLTSGNLLSGDLTNFGWGNANGGLPDGQGFFQFVIDIYTGAAGGDYRTYFGGGSGFTEIHTIELCDAAGGGSAECTLVSGDWETTGIDLMTTNFSTNSWMNSGFFVHGLDGSTFSDTVIPIPAAVWLFGSGLVSLGAVAARRRQGLKRAA